MRKNNYSFFKNAIYPFEGLKQVFESEKAFRLEIFIAVPIIFLSYLFLSIDKFFKILKAFILVLLTELLNSSIEAVVDIASPDYSKLAKYSKDAASASVFLSIVYFFITLTENLFLNRE